MALSANSKKKKQDLSDEDPVLIMRKTRIAAGLSELGDRMIYAK